MTTSRFDYVRYDEQATELQGDFKSQFIELECSVEGLANTHTRQEILKKLEEAYMWIGKAIRDEQIIRNAATEVQESRNDIFTAEHIAELRKLNGQGMISAVGEYTLEKFWEALDEIERLRGLLAGNG